MMASLRLTGRTHSDRITKTIPAVIVLHYSSHKTGGKPFWVYAPHPRALWPLPTSLTDHRLLRMRNLRRARSRISLLSVSALNTHTPPSSRSMATAEMTPLATPHPTHPQEAADDQPDILLCRHANSSPIMSPLVVRRSVLSYALQCAAFLLLGVPILLLFLQLPGASPPQGTVDPSFALPCKQQVASDQTSNDTKCVPFHRSLFPANFVFGTATAAFQVPDRVVLCLHSGVACRVGSSC